MIKNNFFIFYPFVRVLSFIGILEFPKSKNLEFLVFLGILEFPRSLASRNSRILEFPRVFLAIFRVGVVRVFLGWYGAGIEQIVHPKPC
ncbi:MAG: hypothetical protein MR879_07315 [Campylobacter sp.]|nr:hypothetical protein [Campylobacter sp.]